MAPDSAEAVEAVKLLKTLPLGGVIVTGDAAFTYRCIIEAIISIPAGILDAAGLLALSRARWQIENRLFRMRDGTFAEDVCRLRAGQTPRVLAHRRDAVLVLIGKRRLRPKPAREAFATNPKAAICPIRRA